MVGFDAFRASVHTGAGVLLLTGHLGNWEIGGAAIAARGIDLDVIGKGMADPGFEARIMETRSQMGMRVIELGDVREALVSRCGLERSSSMPPGRLAGR